MVARQWLVGMSLGLGFWLTSMPPAMVRAALPTYTLQGVSFETPVPFSEPLAVGRRGVVVIYPASAPSSGGQQFRITLIELGTGMAGFTDLNEAELMHLVRFSLLGVTSPPVGVKERLLMGRLLQGEVIVKRTYRGESYLELYLLPLSTGFTVAIAFEADARMPAEQVENIIATVGRTLREVPPDPEVLKKKLKQKQWTW